MTHCSYCAGLCCRDNIPSKEQQGALQEGFTSEDEVPAQGSQRWVSGWGPTARARTRDSRRGAMPWIPDQDWPLQRAGPVSLWIHTPSGPPGVWENHNLARGQWGS